jgi:hypothetical protein
MEDRVTKDATASSENRANRNALRGQLHPRPTTPKSATTLAPINLPLVPTKSQSEQPLDEGMAPRVKSEDVAMSVPRPNTIDAAPIGALPIPLVPSGTATHSTPSQESHEERTLVPDPSTHLDPPVASYEQHSPSPSPTTQAETIYAERLERLPFKLDAMAALHEANIGLPPTVLSGEEKLRFVRDTYTLLAILSKLGADHSSYLNSVLLGVTAIDSCLTDIAAAAAGVAASNRRENESLRREIAVMREEMGSNGKRLNMIIDTLLEVKETLYEGPRPTGNPSAAQVEPRRFHVPPEPPRPTPAGARVVIIDRIGHVPVPLDIRKIDLLNFCEANGLDCNGILGGKVREASLSVYLASRPRPEHPTTLDHETDMMQDSDDVATTSNASELPMSPNHVQPPSTEYNHPGWVNDSQIRQAEPHVLEGKEYIRSNQLAAIKEQKEGSWVTMASKGKGKKNAKGVLPMAPPPPRTQGTSAAQPSSPLSTFPIDDTTTWIIRFHGRSPPEAQKMKSRDMFNRVNCIDKSEWPFDVVSANWTQGGSGPSILLRFSGATTHRAIETQQMKILSRLDHGVGTATLTQNLSWSKIVVMGVPCIKDYVNDEYVYTDIEEIVEQLKRLPQYQRLPVMLQPRWLGPLHEGQTHADLSFAIEDPFGDLARDFLSRALWLGGMKCPVRQMKDRVAVRQCGRCWRFGQTHRACESRCRLCGRPHGTQEHQQHCETCTREEWSAQGKECSHLSCTNCRAARKPQHDHAADEESCPMRRMEATAARSRSNAMISHQRDQLRRSFGKKQAPPFAQC